MQMFMYHALPYLSRVYLNNRRVILLQDFEKTNENKSYLIYDKDAFGEKVFPTNNGEGT